MKWNEVERSGMK